MEFIPGNSLQTRINVYDLVRIVYNSYSITECIAVNVIVRAKQEEALLSLLI